MSYADALDLQLTVQELRKEIATVREHIQALGDENARMQEAIASRDIAIFRAAANMQTLLDIVNGSTSASSSNTPPRTPPGAASAADR